MASNPTEIASSNYNPSEKQKGAGKTARIPIKIGGTQEQSQAIQAYCRQTLALG